LDLIEQNQFYLLVDAFSSREPESTSLENAMSTLERNQHRAGVRSVLGSSPSLREATRRSNPFCWSGSGLLFAEPVIGRACARPVGRN